MKKRVGMVPIAFFFFIGTAFTDRSGIGFATAVAVGVHECGHFLAAKWMHIPLRSIKFDLLGARINVGDRLLSYSDEWLLAAMGPIFSLVGAIIAAPFWGCSTFAIAFSSASLILGMLNLLPINTFDGGRMAEIFLSRTVGILWTYRIMNAITFFTLFLLWILSVYFLLRAGGGLSLFCFSVSLFARFLESGKIA